MQPKRPVNLNLFTLSYPPMAIASILHRLSGILLFVLLPFIFYIWHLSLESQDSFNHLQAMFSCHFFKLALWAFGAALIYHLLAGIRHLCCDLGWGEHLSTARWTATGVIGLAVVLSIFLGILLW